MFDYRGSPLVEVPCDLCGGMDHPELFLGDRYDMGLRTVICRRCALIFTNPRPDSNALEDFYKNHYRKYYESVDQPDADYLEAGEFEFRANVVYSHVQPFLEELGDERKLIRVLDVGCSEGSVLKKIMGAFPSSIEAYGLEPSPTFSEFARKHTGASIFTGTLGDYIHSADRPERFDLIILNHVLEHFESPRRELGRLRSCLSKHGIMFIEVPNILGKWSGTNMIHLAHLYQFSEDTLRLLLSRVGLAPIMLSKEGNHLHPWAMACVVKESEPDLRVDNDPALARRHAEIVRSKFNAKPNPDFAPSRIKRLASRIGRRIMGLSR